MDVWTDLWPLRKNRFVNIEQITFGLLWEMAGGRPARIVATAKHLKERFSRDGSSLRGHLEKLARIGIIRLVARTRRTGEFLIEVYNPCPEYADAVPDPQMQLPGLWTEGIDDEDAWNAVVKANTQPARVESASGGDAEGASGGEFPAAQTREIPATERRGEFPVGRGEFPASRGVPRGEFPAAEKIPGISAGKNANSSGITQNRGRGEFPAAKIGTAFATNDNDIKNLYLYNGSMKTNDNESNVVIPAAGNSPRETPRGELPATLVRDARKIDGIIAARRAVIEAEESRRMRIGDDAATAKMMAAFNERFADPQAAATAKSQFVNMLRHLVMDCKTKAWLYGFAADLMLVHGVGTGEKSLQIREKMSVYLANLRSVREIETREGKQHRPLGRWLNKEIHAIAEQHGIATPRQRKQVAVRN